MTWMDLKLSLLGYQYEIRSCVQLKKSQCMQKHFLKKESVYFNDDIPCAVLGSCTNYATVVLWFVITYSTKSFFCQAVSTLKQSSLLL